ncbi:MAG: hypothetical protein WA389_20300, partial [Terriglobales bacterium]
VDGDRNYDGERKDGAHSDGYFFPGFHAANFFRGAAFSSPTIAFSGSPAVGDRSVHIQPQDGSLP